MAQSEHFKQQLAIRKERLATDFLQKKGESGLSGGSIKKMGLMSDLCNRETERLQNHQLPLDNQRPENLQLENQRLQLENKRLQLENQQLQLDFARLKLLNAHMIVQMRKVP